MSFHVICNTYRHEYVRPSKCYQRQVPILAIVVWKARSRDIKTISVIIILMSFFGIFRGMLASAAKQAEAAGLKQLARPSLHVHIFMSIMSHVHISENFMYFIL